MFALHSLFDFFPVVGVHVATKKKKEGSPSPRSTKESAWRVAPFWVFSWTKRCGHRASGTRTKGAMGEETHDSASAH
ncbi:hypothetical protein [Pandoravirus japonicus]|uniref:Uncharacterized protein n=1 Tax=Pandoravirus japonicus TaxID=2823154 RepID=A0A811BRX2_9VIRU|nr:hypothetical protein [Pandoravirus japonicus]